IILAVVLDIGIALGSTLPTAKLIFCTLITAVIILMLFDPLYDRFYSSLAGALCKSPARILVVSLIYIGIATYLIYLGVEWLKCCLVPACLILVAGFLMLVKAALVFYLVIMFFRLKQKL
ncbi:MAG: hypothetical protein DRJ03_17405, partial [Chloroflexi bacterium]